MPHGYRCFRKFAIVPFKDESIAKPTTYSLLTSLTRSPLVQFGEEYVCSLSISRQGSRVNVNMISI